MRIRLADPADQEQLVSLVADLRAALSQFEIERRSTDLQAAQKELAEYRAEGYPVFCCRAPHLGNRGLSGVPSSLGRGLGGVPFRGGRISSQGDRVSALR